MKIEAQLSPSFSKMIGANAYHGEVKTSSKELEELKKNGKIRQLELPHAGKIKGWFSVVATHNHDHLEIHMMGGKGEITFLILKTPETVKEYEGILIIEI